MEMKKNELMQFLDKFKKEIPEELIYSLMQSHGNIDDCIEYAKNSVFNFP